MKKNKKLSNLIAIKNSIKKRNLKILKNKNTELKSKEKKLKSFRISAKNLFLTYNLKTEDTFDLKNILGILKSKFLPYGIKDYLIIYEGDSHVHAYFSLFKKLNTTNERFLDIIKDETTIYHGNYQSVRKELSVIEYMLKNIDNKFNQNLILFSKNLNKKITDIGNFMNIDQAMLYLARQGKIREALELLEHEDPKRFLRDRFTQETLLRKHFALELGFTTKFSLKDFNQPTTALIEAIDNMGQKSLFLKGDPGTGKTQFILSYLKSKNLIPLEINNFDSIRYFDDNKHNCILIDDINLKHLNREELLKFVDSEDSTSFRILHGSVLIPKNIKRFIVSNKDLKDIVSIELDNAILRRIQIIDIGNQKLFQIN